MVKGRGEGGFLKKIAVIGVGYLGQHHARILKDFQDVELAAVVDQNIERAEEIASLYKTRPYRDYRDVLEHVDAVSIVTPTTTHFQIARDSLLAGKDVFVEKPLCGTLSEAEELVRLAKERGRLLQVGHLERYNPAYQRAKEFIKSPPRLLIAERLSPFSGRGIDVDITFDLMIHDLDIIVDIMKYAGLGSQKDCYFTSSGYRLMTDHIDFAEARLDFGASQAILLASRVSKEKKRTLTLLCEEMELFVDFMNQTLMRAIPLKGELIFEEIPIEKREPLREELRDFVDCINLRRCPLVSGEDVLYPLRLTIEITKLLHRHQPG